MLKRINWKRIYKDIERFFDKCGGALEKMVQGFFITACLMSLVGMLTSFYEPVKNAFGLVGTICLGVAIMSLGLYAIGFVATIVIRFVFAIMVGIFTVGKWTFKSSFGTK